MKINGLELPIELQKDLESGGRQFTEAEASRFVNLLKHVESPLLAMFDYESIVRENECLSEESWQDYLGTCSDSVVPGDIDPKLAVIIGQVDPDSPIALDYRTTNPRVIYFGDIQYESYWIEVSPDYASLLKMLQEEVV